MSATPFKLLPCPFCGGNNTEIYSAFPNADNPTWGVSHESDYSECPARGNHGRYRNPKDAAAMWNTRLGDSNAQ